MTERFLETGSPSSKHWERDWGGEGKLFGHGARSGAVGFLTDTSLCIGCKACEVACKQWNELPADEPETGRGLTGFSYDNTVDLGATTWRHVAFVEQTAWPSSNPTLDASPSVAWLMMSDVCKHCVHAGCLEACPTGAIIRTEFDTVVIQQDICNGCGYCVPACPFGVPQLDHGDGRVGKCTLCYDRLVDGLEPACAKACPTDSIVFGSVAELLPRGRARVDRLKDRGHEAARLYGDHERGGTGGIDGLNALFVLLAPPETYNLPAAPELPQRKVLPALLSTAAAALSLGLAAAAALRKPS
jgi:formate dehydrogenase iron-sulfur subunit